MPAAKPISIPLPRSGRRSGLPRDAGVYVQMLALAFSAQLAVTSLPATTVMVCH